MVTLESELTDGTSKSESNCLTRSPAINGQRFGHDNYKTIMMMITTMTFAASAALSGLSGLEQFRGTPKSLGTTR